MHINQIREPVYELQQSFPATISTELVIMLQFFLKVFGREIHFESIYIYEKGAKMFNDICLSFRQHTGVIFIKTSLKRLLNLVFHY